MIVFQFKKFRITEMKRKTMIVLLVAAASIAFVTRKFMYSEQLPVIAGQQIQVRDNTVPVPTSQLEVIPSPALQSAPDQAVLAALEQYQTATIDENNREILEEDVEKSADPRAVQRRNDDERELHDLQHSAVYIPPPTDN